MSNLLTSLGATFRTALTAVGVVPYDTNGNTKTLDLPVTALSKNLTLRLFGNNIIGTSTATNWYDSPLGLLKKIELVADGHKTIFSASGRMLFAYGHFMRGRVGQQAVPAMTVGTRAFSVTLILDHESKHFMDPVETLFDATRYKTLQLRITWGTAADIGKAGASGTFAVDAANTGVDVMLEQTIVGEDRILFDHLLTSVVVPVTATNPKVAIDIPQTGLLANILLQTTREAALGPVFVDDIINTVSLKSDTTVAHVDAVKWATLQAKNAVQYNLSTGLSGDNVLPGYAALKLHENGMISSALNVAAINKTQLLLDVKRTSDAENVEILFDFLEPRRA